MSLHYIWMSTNPHLQSQLRRRQGLADRGRQGHDFHHIAGIDRRQVLGEEPGSSTLLGGAIVLSTLAINTVWKLKASRVETVASG